MWDNAWACDVNCRDNQRLNNTVFTINDEWVVDSLFLAGSPEKFSPIIMAIEHLGIEITAAIIKTKFIEINAEGQVNCSA